jgi:hypothetical protein
VGRTGRHRRQNDERHADECDQPARHRANPVCVKVGDSSTAAGCGFMRLAEASQAPEQNP